MQAQILSEIFPIQIATLPPLFVYELRSGTDLDSLKSLSWKLAYSLRQQTQKMWVASECKLVSDHAVKESEWESLLKSCWEHKPELAAIEGLTATNRGANSAEQACFVAKGLLTKFKRQFERIIEPAHVRIGEVEVLRKVICDDMVVQGQPCVSVSLRSETVFHSDLIETLNRFPGLLEKGVKVRCKLDGNTGELASLKGLLGQHRERLLAHKPRPEIAEAIRSGTDQTPIISLKKRNFSYDYPAHILELVPHPEIYSHLKLNAQAILKAQRLDPQVRWQWISALVKPLQAAQILTSAWVQPVSVKNFNDSLLLGNNQVFSPARQSILPQLKKCGLYAPNQISRKIRTRVIYFCPSKKFEAFKVAILNFLSDLRQECRSFGVNLNFEGKNSLQLHEGTRGEIERTVAQLKQENATDFVLSVLPFEHAFEDENADENSMYRVLKQTLLRSGIQSQNMVLHRLFESGSQSKPGYSCAITNLVLGILAKTGQVPYVLAEPMQFTDFVVGLDISRKAKQRSSGSTNVVAATRVFKNDGNFFSYHLLPPDVLEGETLSRRVIEELFPLTEFENKRVLIHRDGPYRQNEKAHFERWGQEIGAQFHLVSVIKTGNPRLYRQRGAGISAPSKGDLITINENEALMVSSLPPFGNATPQPLRIVSDGSLPLEQAVESVYKLTLLHYGSQAAPRLPITVHYSDQMAWMAQRGIRPGQAVGTLPYWI